MPLHSLLRRQLKRAFGDPNEVPEACRRLVDEVDAAYHEFDADRRMVERSLELSSQELLQANSEMRAVFNTLPDLFIWLDRDGLVLNTQAGRSSDLYVASDQLIGKRVQDFPDREVGEQFATALAEVRTTGQMSSLEYSLTGPDGAGSYEARLVPLVNFQTLVVVRNITERKAYEQAIAAEKELLSVTLRAIADGVVTTDAHGRVALMNRVAEKLTGWQQEEAVGRPVEEVLVIRDARRDAQQPIAMLDPASAGGWMPSKSLVLVAQDGTTRNIAQGMAPIRDSNNAVAGTVVVLRDVTEERRQDEDRLRATKLESLGTLAGGIAHDFNNLLTGIIGYLSIAQIEVEGQGELAVWLREANQAACRARDLTLQLLTFSKGGAPVKETASVAELIRDCAVFAARGTNADCKFEIADDLRAVEVDSGQISQVIHNLIINAHQAMPSGGELRIGARNVRVTEHSPIGLPRGDYVRIFVRDAGIGIPRDYLPKIFDPYFTTKQEGSGLGLATCYSIVRNHDGRITVDSEVGEGTTFEIYLPGLDLPVAPRPAEPARRIDGGRGKVLVMDDEASVRQVAKQMLRILGYEHETANDGAEAIAILEAARAAGEPFHAVLMDLTVPGGLGGRDTVVRVREIDQDLVVIASSGYSNDPILASHADYGFTDVLSKPYSIQQLDRVLKTTLDAPLAG